MLDSIPERHKPLIKVFEILRNHAVKNAESCIGVFNLSTGEDVTFVTTIGVYASGDAFAWFMDLPEQKYYLYSFVNKKLKQMLTYSFDRANEFAGALQDLQTELKERGNPVTIRR